MITLQGAAGSFIRFIPTGVLWPFFLSRIWVALWVYLAHVDRPFLAPVSGGWKGVNNWWLNPWTAYDSLWFTRIAMHGYELKSTSYFPLYPSLLKLAGSDIVAIVFWGVVVSNVALLVALATVYQLTTLDHSRSIARLTVWAVAFFPTSAYFSAVYTESVFLLFLAATFLCVRSGRGLRCGLYWRHPHATRAS